MVISGFYLLALSFGFTISIALLITVLISKKTNSSQFYLGKNQSLDPRMAKIVSMIGGDLLSIVPKSVKQKTLKDKKLDDLFRESGNPWNLTKLEFLAVRATYALIFGVVFTLFSIIVNPPILVMVPIVLLGIYFGWSKPISKYKKVAKERNLSFKKNMPELLDYLTMIISDGSYTFPNAIEAVLPHLKESIVKEEFSKVLRSIEANSTVEDALNQLAARVPSTSLESFVQAVNNANKLNTPLDILMKTQAEKLRKDLLTEIRMTIQVLPTKTMLTVGPPAIFAILIVFMTPVIAALIQQL